MYLVVAGAAQRHQVIVCMSAALGYGQDVMDLFNRSHSSFLQASFTQRMALDITVTDSLPCTTVFLVHVWGALVSVVLTPVQGFMFGAVLSVRKAGTAWV